MTDFRGVFIVTDHASKVDLIGNTNPKEVNENEKEWFQLDMPTRQRHTYSPKSEGGKQTERRRDIHVNT